MKRLIIIFMGLFLVTSPLFAGYSAMASDDPAGTMGRKIKISLWIEIGRPSRDCKGFGICDWGFSLNLDDAVRQMTVTKAGGEGYFDDDGSFVMEFLRKYMMDETATTYFRNGFILEENTSIPPDILRRLEHPDEYVIKEGTYPVRQTTESIIVKF
ncbi:MAG: hypothetical protein PHD61_02805 [Bacteroidales bacterium]|nr:hypothetical protein [Lentimicrobiaceae bacterium]MDD5694219.1 hypothetical protein [Bacteroidales bacterium]